LASGNSAGIAQLNAGELSVGLFDIRLSSGTVFSGGSEVTVWSAAGSDSATPLWFVGWFANHLGASDFLDRLSF